MALERRASDKRAVAMAAGAMGLVAVVSLALVLDAVRGGGERSVASPAAERERTEARAPANPPIRSETALWKLKADGSRRAVTSGRWPAGQEGWTVVLSTMYDEEGALRFAHDVEAAGVDAGVLSTEDFPALGTGVWYVYSGVYADEIEAGEAAAELAAAYPGASTQYVQ
jgi:hypothetical protein